MTVSPQTDDKSEKFAQFKERIKDCELPDKRDIYLKRWLIARNYDLDLAEKMLRTSLDWRKKHNADHLLDVWTYPEVAKKYYSFGKLGTDKFGCPLWMTGQGMIDWKGFHLSLCKRDIIKFLICNTEMMARDIDEECRRTGKETTYITLIFDMDKLSMRQIAHKQTMDTAREMVNMFEANYPESLRRVFIINAPKLFSLAFNMIKPFMQQNTLDKLKFFGHNKEEWAAAMLEEIEPDQLPVLYGGTMTDPDGNPNCPSRFNLGGEIPSTYYMCNNRPTFKENMEKAVIVAGASGTKKLKFEVNTPNSTLRWEFFTEGGDIRFRVYFKNSDGKVDLVPLVRVESHLVTEEGYVTCDNVGQYVVLFDNTFSYFRQKKLNYRITMEPPKEKPEP